jgi:NADH-quinone oxidoreductase subunit H
MAGIQRRRGPDVVGAWGLIQPFADAAKLILKETILPSTANTVLFVIAPILSFMLSLVGWAVIPFGETFVLSDINIGVLYLFAVSSLGVYGIIMSGWASNSKYAFLGGLRSAAQMVSYEVSIGFIIIAVVLCAGSLNLSTITLAQKQVWYCVPLFPMFFMFFISALAETNRHPFDLPEAEAELVAGYNVEYSAAGFALFFLGEYANMIMMSSVTTILFLGGWLPFLDFFPFTFVPGPIWFGLKVCIFVALFVWARAAYPRYRYDQLMRLGWKVFLPLSLGWVLFISGILLAFNWLPFII